MSAARPRSLAPLASLAAALALTSGGCLEPAFSAHARDNSVEDLRRALATVQPSSAPGRATVYLLAGERADRHLVAYDLEAGRSAWDVAADVTSRLAVGQGFVAHRQGKQAIAVRASDGGQVRCTIALKPEEQFIGLSADSRVYYVVQSSTGESRISTLVAAAPDTCAELWRDPAVGTLGAPAARGGVVVVPFAYQNVVLLDGKTGAELARVRATDESVSFVRATSDGFFYGDNKGVYLLAERSAAGTKKGSAYVEAHLGSAQIRTFYYWDAYQPSQADYTAFDRNRLLWRAQPSGEGIAFRDGAAYLHSYRYFFAFDAASGDIRWAYAHPKFDLVGSDDAGPSILFASVDGEIGALDARTGQLAYQKQTGLKLSGATFDADGFAPHAAPAPAAAADKGLAEPARTLADIVWDPDARFTAVKVFAVGAMTRVPGTDVTAELVKVVTREGGAPAVAKAAADALIARRDGEARSIYRAALARRYDYLADRRPHGVDVLARVVAVVADKEALPLLAAHLLDAATPLPALKDIVKAVVSLGGADAAQPLRDLLLTYRADPAFIVDPQSLELAADGLLKLGGAEGRRTVAFVADEPRTTPALGAYLRRALHGTPEHPSPAAAAPSKEPVAPRVGPPPAASASASAGKSAASPASPSAATSAAPSRSPAATSAAPSTSPAATSAAPSTSPAATSAAPSAAGAASPASSAAATSASSPAASPSTAAGATKPAPTGRQ